MREEEDLRAALRTLERHAPDPDAMLAAVRSTAGAPQARRGWRRTRVNGAPRGWARTVAPLAAAASVIAVVTGLTLVANMTGPVPARPGKSRVTQPQHPLPLTASGIPGYFLATPGNLHTDQPNGARLLDTGIPPSLRSHENLQIIATATGRVAATVRVPGYVTAIAASSGAFFAAVVRGPRAWFYEIRLAAGHASATAARLPIPADTAPIGFMAVSPDGGKLAYSTLARYGAFGVIRNLVVAATANGAERRWGAPAQEPTASMGTMSFLADGKTLAFNWTGPATTSPSSALRLLDTTAPGNDLLAGRAVLRLVNQYGGFADYTISPDGKTLIGILACVPGCHPSSFSPAGGRSGPLGSVIRFPVAGGAPEVLYTEPTLPGSSGHSVSACSDPMWISATGRKLLLVCVQHRPATPQRKAVTRVHVLLLANGRIRELPWLAATPGDITAFPGITAYGGVPALPPNP
jgi:hypothetical protein